MILEIATFDIKTDSIDIFKAACEKATLIVSQSEGFLGLDFQQCLETKTKFIVMIKWATLEDHMVGFRSSTLFTEWRAILSPHFNTPPVAEHYSSYNKL